MAESESLIQEKILAFLASRDGSIADVTGRGLTAQLAEAIGYDKSGALNQLLKQMESEGMITRDIRGLRTYRIALAESQPVTVPAAVVSPAARSLPPEPIAEPVPAPPPGLNRPRKAVDWRSLVDVPTTPTERVGAPKGTTVGAASEPAGGWRTAERSEAPAEPQAARTAPAAPPPAATAPKPPATTGRPWSSIASPRVSRPPHTTVLAIVGATIAVLVIATVVSVIVSGGSSKKGSTAADNSNSTIDSCTLVTNEEVSAAFGGDAQGPHEVLRACVFDNGSHQLIVDAADNKAKARFDAARDATAQDVPGLGDGAYYENGRLGVLKGSHMLLMTLVPFSPTAPSPELMTLAKAAVTRL